MQLFQIEHLKDKFLFHPPPKKKESTVTTTASDLNDGAKQCPLPLSGISTASLLPASPHVKYSVIHPADESLYKAKCYLSFHRQRMEEQIFFSHMKKSFKVWRRQFSQRGIIKKKRKEKKALVNWMKSDKHVFPPGQVTESVWLLTSFWCVLKI